MLEKKFLFLRNIEIFFIICCLKPNKQITVKIFNIFKLKTTVPNFSELKYLAIKIVDKIPNRDPKEL